MNSKQTEGNTVRDFLKEYYEWDENEHEPQQSFIHSSISDLEQLITDYFASLPSKPASGAYVSAKTSWPNKRGSFVIRYQNGRTDSWFIDQPNDTAKETWFKAANNWLFEWWDENAIAEAPSKPVSEDATVTEQEMSSLRWLLNVSSEKPKTQLFTALDNCCDKEGISNRTHLENLWNKLKSGYAAAPQKGMKWVKASERMPEDLKRNYIVRQMGNSRSVRSVWWEHIHGNVEGSLKLPLYHIEWLDEPYFVWCDVEGCEEEGCSGGNSWRATGYWVVCYKHSQDHRDGKPQPKMKQKAIDRETTRGAEGKLMRGE